MSIDTEQVPTEAPESDDNAAAIADAKAARSAQLVDRLINPLLLPVLCTGIVVLLAINVSRLLLASGHGGSLWAVIILTIAFLVGFAAVSAARNMRNVTSMVLLGVVVMALLVAGGLTFSEGQPAKEAAVKIGEVPADYTGPITPLVVDALPTLKFNKDLYNAPAGAIEIDYVNLGGQHTLVFSDARFSWFELAVNAQGETAKGKIRFEAGSYEFYCSVPGHKAAGMEAKLIVGPAS
ncbi:MAG: plastocyanin/azurin family copper-binding protein [Acidimicrobiia bacterium]